MTTKSPLEQAQARILALEAEVDKHKARRDHFEDLLNDSIRKENEWAKRALAAEAENARITLQYDQLDDIFRQRGLDLSQSMVRVLELEKENARLRGALNTAELTAANANSSRDDPWKILADIENLIGNALKEVGNA